MVPSHDRFDRANQAYFLDPKASFPDEVTAVSTPRFSVAPGSAHTYTAEVQPRAFQIHAQDNVATLLDDAPVGPVTLLGAVGAGTTVETIEPVPRTHKLALADLAPGQAVLKYGVPIGRATRPIPRGAWVHLHNLASALDERSSSLDVHTGAPTDTATAYA